MGSSAGGWACSLTHLPSAARADRDWLARMASARKMRLCSIGLSSSRLAQILLLVEVKFKDRKQNHGRNPASELEHDFAEFFWPRKAQG